MAKREQPPKKGPKMATAHKPTDDDFADRELDSGFDAFATKLHSTIEEARSKMSDEEVEEADRKAKAIFDRANAVAKSPRHSA